MKKKYENIFFLAGLAVLIFMATRLDYDEVWTSVSQAGYWFLAVVVLWFFLYFFNTAAWRLIIKSQEPHQELPFTFLWLYKITVSGFALNYATPGGLMGGEPYRIMMLAPKIGTERATSSVILHTMTHIFSHFWFWLLSCLLYVVILHPTLFTAALIAVIAPMCIVAIWFFLKGYRQGIAVGCMRMLSHIPIVKKWALGFFERHKEQLSAIDERVASLHNQNPLSFALAVGLELSCRIVSALEIYFILLVIMPSANYLVCILILAFTSLVANLLFFIPLQLGGRESGFLLSANGVGLTVSAGIFVALLVRLRELIWTAIGLLLIKTDKRRMS